MERKKISTNYKGVRFREDTGRRRYRGQPDKYFFIRYRVNGKSKEEGLGWASEGMTAKIASETLAELKKANRLGEGAQTLADKKKIKEETEKNRKKEEARLAKENISFNEVWKKYFFMSQNNKKVSLRREESLCRIWIAPVIGEIAMIKVMPFHIEKIKKNMSDARKSERSIRYAIAVIRQVYNYARANSFINCESPTNKVKKPQKDNRRDRFLTREEAERLFEVLKKKSQQLYEIAYLSYDCGLRAGEIFSLTWEHIDLDRGMICLRDTKGNNNRFAHMTEKIKSIFANKQPGENNAFVFPDRNGEKMKSISNTFDRVVKELGFNDNVKDRRHRVVFHTLRHTYASRLVEKNVDLYLVQKCLGHSTIKMTERYSHFHPEKLKQTAKLLDETHNEKKEQTQIINGIKLNFLN